VPDQCLAFSPTAPLGDNLEQHELGAVGENGELYSDNYFSGLTTIRIPG
jgi:hypothetical protein